MNIGSIIFGTNVNGTLASRTGNIGIGTVNPQGSFHVDGAKDNPVTGAPNATQQLDDVTVNNAGNVGIGTTSPTNKIDVMAAAGTADITAVRLRANSATAAVGQSVLIGFHPNTIVGGNAPWGIGAQFVANAVGQGDADFIFKSSNGAAYVDRMIIRNNGNVGIATTSPATNFQIGSGLTGGLANPTMRLTSSLNSYAGGGVIQFLENNQQYGIIVRHHSGNDTTTTDKEGLYFNDIALNTENTVPILMLEQVNKRVGVGTANPTEKLHVIGNILASGTITPSDIRIKKDIEDNSYGLKEIMKLRTINYHYKDESLSKEKKIGFIAQQIKEEIPELVTVANDKMNTLGVNYAEMTVVLTKAIQEQQKEIEILKAQIKELQKK